MYKLVSALVLLLFVACGTTRQATESTAIQLPQTTVREGDDAFVILDYTDDATYGFTETNPVLVGGVTEGSGPYNERRFLNGLTGPEGQAISYTRLMSCCGFKTPNGYDGGGLLDVYQVNWEGQAEPVRLYLNMYDAAELMVPVGMRSKSQEKN